MLIGEYTHNLDPKKRFAIPSKFRRELGEKIVVTKGLDNCLFVFPLNEWQIMAEKLGKLSIGQQDSRGFVRLLLSGASEVEFDQLGRILVPDYLKEYAGLQKKIVIAGLFNRLEIWDEAAWKTYKSNLEKNTDRIAEKLGEIGAI